MRRTILSLLFALAEALWAETDLSFVERFVAGQATLNRDPERFLTGRLKQSDRKSTKPVLLEKVEGLWSDRYSLYGRVFIPGAALPTVVAAALNYSSHAGFYPSVARSRECPPNKQGERVFRYWTKPGRPTITESKVRVTNLLPARYLIESEMTGALEHSDPADLCKIELQPAGWVKTMRSFWRYEAADGGVYLESDGLALVTQLPLANGKTRKALREMLTEALGCIQLCFRGDGLRTRTSTCRCPAD